MHAYEGYMGAAFVLRRDTHLGLPSLCVYFTARLLLHAAIMLHYPLVFSFGFSFGFSCWFSPLGFSFRFFGWSSPLVFSVRVLLWFSHVVFSVGLLR